MTINAMDDAAETDTPLVREARVWRDNGWTARVIKNEDDEGWAVEMILDGEVEPVLVGPWTMGRDKKNPKPIDSVAFNTLVKTASEFRLRQEQQLHAAHHQSVTVNAQSRQISVTLEIVADEDDPHALLRAHDANNNVLAQVRVEPGYKLSRASASAWIADDFRKPR
jgi:hypothetical protein